MKRLGMDIGTSTIKVAVLEDQVIKYKNIRKHYGKILPVLKEMLEEACAPKERMAMCVTGSNAQAVLGAEDEIPYLGYIRRLRKASVIRCRRQEVSLRSEAREPVLSQTLKNRHRSLRSTSTVPGEPALFLKTRCPAWD